MKLITELEFYPGNENEYLEDGKNGNLMNNGNQNDDNRSTRLE